MFCKKCGYSLDENSKYCPKCGTPVDQGESKRDEEKYNGNGKKDKKLWIVFAMILFIGIILCVTIPYLNKKMEQKEEAKTVEKYNEVLLQAQEYQQKDEIDNAIRKYEEAIELLPQEEIAYVELAQLYDEQGDRDQALQVLEDGVSQTHSLDIEALRDEFQNESKKEVKKEKKPIKKPIEKSEEKTEEKPKEKSDSDPAPAPAPAPQQDTRSSYDVEALRLTGVQEESQEIKEAISNSMPQGDINYYLGMCYTLWDDEINYMWGLLKANLPASRYDPLLLEQQQWIKDKEAAVEAAVDENGCRGGSMETQIRCGVAARWTEERCYQLLNEFTW